VAAGLAYDSERLAAALGEGYATATDLADYLVGKGVPFRAAHEQAGLAVREAERRGSSLAELPIDVMRSICPLSGNDVAGYLSPEASVRSRRSEGGPAPEAVSRQIELAERDVAKGREWLGERQPSPIYRAHREGRLSAREIA
jgi:argininosuccinate lyase